MTTTISKPRLQLLDALRFVAAMSVLCYHWLYSGIQNGKVPTIEHSPVAGVASYGYLGVHLFFLISGFVIANSAMGKTPAQYAVGRLVRLYPAYWVAMLFTASVAVFYGSTVMTVSFPQVLANTTMVSRLFGQTYIDGVYWTLFYELAFYVMVFLIMMLGLTRYLDKFFPTWTLCLLGVALFLPSLSNTPLIGGLFALFGSGAIFSIVQRKGWTLSRALALIAGLITAEIYIYKDLTLVLEGDQNPFVVGSIVFGFFLLLLIQIQNFATKIRIPGSQLLGGLTYPLYLIHAHFGYMMFANFSNESNKWVVYAICLAVVLALSWLLHEFVENRMKNFWYRFFGILIGKPIAAITTGMEKVRYRITNSKTKELEKI